MSESNPQVSIVILNWNGLADTRECLHSLNSFSYAKRHIISSDALTFYGFNTDPIIGWPSAEVSGYASSAHVHPYKTLWSDRWYRNLTTSKLTLDRAYFSGIPPATWDAAINIAIMEPQIQYAKTNDAVNIAYWTHGEGMPLVHLPPMLPFSHIQREWQNTGFGRWYERLAERTMLVRSHARGTGMSQREGGAFRWRDSCSTHRL